MHCVGPTIRDAIQRPVKLWQRCGRQDDGGAGGGGPVGGGGSCMVPGGGDVGAGVPWGDAGDSAGGAVAGVTC